MEELPPLLTPKELAALLSTSEAAIAQDRYLGRGIPFTKVGARVRYLREDVIAHLTAHRTTGTAQKTTAPVAPGAAVTTKGNLHNGRARL